MYKQRDNIKKREIRKLKLDEPFNNLSKRLVLMLPHYSKFFNVTNHQLDFLNKKLHINKNNEKFIVKLANKKAECWDPDTKVAKNFKNRDLVHINRGTFGRADIWPVNKTII
ncbi:hypothetical protein BpHYR1_042217 [Brachionus plicatilis]|uniref:Uncharacterized protein n=1 Tax=Brachionus plicatilis TaxID=10195 RepID=A0A3M7P1I9_BRAPC|nr:hypothetical protein BpHYR1_042217 [Brachionus plicatilis]